MFQETRKRLAIWYTTITAIVLLIFATTVYFYVSNTLIERIDDTLKHIVEVIERSLVIEETKNLEIKYKVNVEASFRNNNNNLEDDHIEIEWFNSMGELIWTTFNEAPKIPLTLGRSGKTVYLSQEHLLRQVTKRIDFGRYVLGYLRISHSWFEFTKPIRQLTLDLILAISLMIISVGGIGWFLSGIAIKPVKDSYQSLKQFTADASHELRNPIAMIQTNVQLALIDENDRELQQKQLQVIERLTKRLGVLVNDLLFLARSDSGILKNNFNPVPLDALLLEIIEEQRIYAKQKGIKLDLKIPEDDNLNLQNEEQFTINGDWDQLARLFTNIISNGLQYSQENSEKQDKQLIVELQLIKKERNPKLQVKIMDNGIGISEEILPHIFDRFYRVDSVRSSSKNKDYGSGLGLAIAKAIVENHQGQITVESRINQGTTFNVILPINNYQIN